MANDLLTAGQFAKLASTTKRTVLWYEEKGILKPTSVDATGYRFYKPEQIIDFQIILLLRSLNFSIEQIKEFLSQNISLRKLFEAKHEVIATEIERLKKKLDIIDTYSSNVDKEGVLIKPELDSISPTKIYYISKEGPYAKIYTYGLELQSYLTHVPKNAEYVCLFEDPGYKPVKSRYKVGIIANPDIQIKSEYRDRVKEMTIPSYKVLSYTHHGSPSLLSFHWKQLEKYARLHHIESNLSLPFINLEIYKHTGLNGEINEEKMVTEMHLPIR